MLAKTSAENVSFLKDETLGCCFSFYYHFVETNNRRSRPEPQVSKQLDLGTQMKLSVTSYGNSVSCSVASQKFAATLNNLHCLTQLVLALLVITYMSVPNIVCIRVQTILSSEAIHVNFKTIRTS
jgi:hypothetical protein